MKLLEGKSRWKTSSCINQKKEGKSSRKFEDALDDFQTSVTGYIIYSFTGFESMVKPS